ncbi:diacylglycerol/lipid kinase family protein [Deinococcus multiflagellatus]|uniref:Diacylglycerol/lipid kinase family protein n=1 Tax=Deinococcus multiflagellatus TaxID=1656887 RepID=A0ABW1ZMT2_9DEIO|nr:diacylglycerol kinase family protein [Deinococcus multiflagellatus]MBZ9715995.1 diacylglycerol kinase family lipid kinase [Deinococcus multiflagellatus]
MFRRPGLSLQRLPATLIYNPRAGSSHRAPPAALCRALHDAGFAVTLHVTRHTEELGTLLGQTSGTIFLAGGDGTLRTGALHLLGRRDVTLGVLPMGTANNVARALNLFGDPLAVAQRFGQARPMPFDVGRIRGSWGEDHFLEACGCGLFADILDDYGPHLAKSPVRALGSTLEAFAMHQPLGLHVTVDGRPLPSPPVAVLEVMNTPSTGNGLHLAPGARVDDGLLNLVRVDGLRRAPMLTYAQAMRRGTFHQLPSVHSAVGRRFVIADQGQVWHLDTELRRSTAPGGVVEVEVVAGALQVLSPAQG